MIDDYLKLNGKHILVTGATSGIGKQTAILLSQLGAKVSVVGRNQERLDEVFLKMDGDGNYKYSFDFKNIDDIESLVKTIVQDGGPLDGLVHSAGITKDLPLANSKNKYVQDIMVTNFNSFIELVRCATKKHRFNEGMSIVGLSSVTANGAAVALSAYAASKAAINGAMRCMARELAPKGIRVNSVLPGPTNTEMYRAHLELKGVVVDKTGGTPGLNYLGMGEPEDVANPIAFLLSPVSRMITGVELPVDGGLLSC